LVLRSVPIATIRVLKEPAYSKGSAPSSCLCRTMVSFGKALPNPKRNGANNRRGALQGDDPSIEKKKARSWVGEGLLMVSSQRVNRVIVKRGWASGGKKKIDEGFSSGYRRRQKPALLVNSSKA